MAAAFSGELQRCRERLDSSADLLTSTVTQVALLVYGRSAGSGCHDTSAAADRLLYARSEAAGQVEAQTYFWHALLQVASAKQYRSPATSTTAV